MAGARHGMRELTRHGMAWERHGNGLGSEWTLHDMYELAFNGCYKVPTSSCRSERDDGVEIKFLKVKLQSLL
jgi:hypothetical protein